MDEALRKKILGILDEHRIMTVATNRPDGWPQATTVGYVSDGLTLYFLCDPHSQKAKNLERDSRISLTIDHDPLDPLAILGVSMAAHAQAVTDPNNLTLPPMRHNDHTFATGAARKRKSKQRLKEEPTLSSPVRPPYVAMCLSVCFVLRLVTIAWPDTNLPPADRR